MSKKRKIPLRKCIVSKEMLAKQELIRVVRTKEGQVFVDTTGKMNGRGAYLSKKGNIIEQAIDNKVLEEQLKVTIPVEVYEQLKELVVE